MFKRRYIYIAAALAVAAAGFFLIKGDGKKPVETYTTVLGEAQRVLAVNGRIRPRLSVDVRPQLSGRLEMLSFDVGDRVEKGDVLARIDDAPESAAIDEARAAVETQQATLAQARRELARYEALGDFAARRDVEERRLAVVEGERELNRRRANVTQASELRERRILRAPFAGVILERPVDPGQTVGTESVIYRLADLSAPEVTAEVDEIYAAEIHPEMEALVSLSGHAAALPADVVHIEPRVDPATGARDVRLALREVIADAPAGLTVTVNLIVEKRAQAVSIPRRSIVLENGAAQVRIVDADGTVQGRAISFIDWPAERVIVTSGLKPGERILIDPGAARPGDKVQVAP